MVGEDDKGPAFQTASKVLDREVERQYLSVEGGVLLLCRGKLLRVEGQRLAVRTLAEDGADRHVGSVLGQGN